jgi:hypothetical protein
MTQDQVNNLIKGGKVLVKLYNKNCLIDSDQIKLHQEKDALVQDTIKNGTDNSAKIIRLNRKIRKNVMFVD